MIGPNTVEPRYKKGLSDWQNSFAISRFRYIEVLFQMFYNYRGKENRSLYQGLRYTGFIVSRFHCSISLLLAFRKPIQCYLAQEPKTEISQDMICFGHASCERKRSAARNSPIFI